MSDNKNTAFAIGAAHWPGISKLMEEAGEVVQVCGKLMATYGEAEHWDGTNLARRLEEELGDLIAACEFVTLKNEPRLSEYAIKSRRDAKLAVFCKWHAEGDPSPAASADDALRRKLRELCNKLEPNEPRWIAHGALRTEIEALLDEQEGKSG